MCFLVRGDTKFSFARTKPISDNSCGIILVEAVLGGQAVAGDRRAAGIHSRARNAHGQGVAVCWGEASELGSTRVWCRDVHEFGLRGRARLGEGGIFLPDVRIARRRRGFGLPIGLGHQDHLETKNQPKSTDVIAAAGNGVWPSRGLRRSFQHRPAGRSSLPLTHEFR